MTDAMIFFQSIFRFRNFAPAGIGKAEIELTISLKNEARRLAALADREMLSGRASQALAFAAPNRERARIFAEITIWHHRRAAEKYRQAAERFAEIGRIQAAKSKTFNSMNRKLTRCAAEAEAAVELYRRFFKTNEDN